MSTSSHTETQSTSEPTAQPHTTAQPQSTGHPPMRIGEVAELTGTTARTIRYYEEIGMLGCSDQRELGKHRCYTEHDVAEIQRIVRLRDLLGLPLEKLVPMVKADRTRERLQREYHATDDPERRRELLESSLEQVSYLQQIVSDRLEQLRELEAELDARESRITAALEDHQQT